MHRAFGLSLLLLLARVRAVTSDSDVCTALGRASVTDDAVHPLCAATCLAGYTLAWDAHAHTETCVNTNNNCAAGTVWDHAAKTCVACAPGERAVDGGCVACTALDASIGANDCVALCAMDGTQVWNRATRACETCPAVPQDAIIVAPATPFACAVTEPLAAFCARKIVDDWRLVLLARVHCAGEHVRNAATEAAAACPPLVHAPALALPEVSAQYGTTVLAVLETHTAEAATVCFDAAPAPLDVPTANAMAARCVDASSAAMVGYEIGARPHLTGVLGNATDTPPCNALLCTIAGTYDHDGDARTPCVRL